MPIYKDEKRGTYYISEYINKKRVVRRGFKKNKDAKDALKLLQNEKVGISKDITLDDAYNLYIEDYTRNIKGSTILSMKNAYENHIKDFFVDIPIKEINSVYIMKYKKHLAEKNISKKKGVTKHLSVGTLNLTLTKLKMIFNFAVIHLGLDKNPCVGVGNFKEIDNIKEKVKFIDYKSFFERIETVENEIHKALFKVLFLEGMRVNELLALQVKDVSLNFGKITINKSYGILKSGKYGITTPKNKYSIRIVDMLNETKSILSAHIKKNKLKQNDFLFYKEKPLSCTDLIYHLHLTFPELNLHSLRHSNISWLLSIGVDAMYIAKRVGHKDTTQIIKTYGHWYEDRKFAMLDVINNSSRDTTVILKKSKNSTK